MVSGGDEIIRRKYTNDFKQQVIKEASEAGNNVVVARRHDLNPNMVGRWVREHNKGKSTKASDTDPVQDYNQITKENEQLKKLLGEKDLEIAMLKDLIKKKNPHLLTKLK